MYLAIEGVNGAGKSSTINLVKKILEGKNKKILVTREPGGTEFGKIIRKLVQESPEFKLSPITELLLFSADRKEHIEKVIKPALKDGFIVLSDRCFWSTIAFQGYGRGLDLKTIEDICKITVGSDIPDKVFLLDLDPVTGFKRNYAAFKTGDSFEGDITDLAELKFHTNVRTGFLELAKKFPSQIIDATLSVEAIADIIANIITAEL